MIKIANPISEDLSTVRTVMAHALLLDVAYNLSVGNKDLRFFEVGRVYQPKSLPLKELPVENNRISLQSPNHALQLDILKFLLLQIVFLANSTKSQCQIQRNKHLDLFHNFVYYAKFHCIIHNILWCYVIMENYDLFTLTAPVSLLT